MRRTLLLVFVAVCVMGCDTAGVSTGPDDTPGDSDGDTDFPFEGDVDGDGDTDLPESDDDIHDKADGDQDGEDADDDGGEGESSEDGDAEIEDPEPDGDIEPEADDSEEEAEVEPEAEEEETWEDDPFCQNPVPLIESFVMGDNLALEGELDHQITTCRGSGHVLVACRDMTVSLVLSGPASPVSVTVYNAYAADHNPASEILAERLAETGEMSLLFHAPHSGEYVVVVSHQEQAEGEPYHLRASCQSGCTKECTRYPVVLVHGFAGTDSYLFGLVDYFFQVPDDLTGRGYEVSTPVTNAVDSSTVRAAQLAPQVDSFMASRKARKVNIIAHSQGGLDSRWIISRMGFDTKVATLTTVSTPHYGMRVIPGILSGASIGEFDEKHMVTYFNPLTPNMPGIRYFSYAGRSCGLLDFSCQRQNNGEIIDTLLTASYLLLKGEHGWNDGVVPHDSGIWGEFLGTLPADHWDEIGQVADLLTGPFDHKKFYRDECRRLRGLGF